MPTAPSAPSAVNGTIDNGKSAISFTPGSDGGSTITGFTVTATDLSNPGAGGQVVSGSASPITVPGLANGDNYTFTVHATNAVGNSAESAASPIITPSSSGTGGQAPNPFPGLPSLTFTVTKAINSVQLDDEISTAVGQTVLVAMSGYNPQLPISVSNPATLWLRPNTVSSTTVQNAINAHVADPNYGTPAHILAFNAVMQAVIANEEIVLTSQQIQDAVKGLLLRYSVTSTSPGNS
jgi:hypothetical protein